VRDAGAWSDVYLFREGEHVAWFHSPAGPFGVVLSSPESPTGMFGNYGVRVQWERKEKPELIDDLDLIPVPVVDLLAHLASRTGRQR
jgi:hypothetical protein